MRAVCIVFRTGRVDQKQNTSPKMLCHVTRPDAVVMEIEVDAKANGEDCLNQVR